jgi:hypothetical protein
LGTLRLLQPDKQETSFCLLLDVKDIPRAPGLQDNPLFGIDGGYAHGGVIPTWLIFVQGSKDKRGRPKNRRKT